MKNQYAKSNKDKGLFIQKDHNQTAFCGIMVDDCLYATTNETI
jgi:hypothetical protein